MNEIISVLERCREKAEIIATSIRCRPIGGPALDYRAVFEMAIDHLRDTITIFRHARELKNELEAARKPEEDEREDPPA